MGECGGADFSGINKDEALRLKGGAIVAILVAGALGIAIPIVGKNLKYLQANGKPFLVTKAFAAGVILATGFVHVLADASERLASECLPEMPWHKFPWTGFVTMLAVLLTLLVDALGTEYYGRKNGVLPLHAHCHVLHESASAAHVAVDSNVSKGEKETEQLRSAVISQVLELGIIAHSVIIGISVGVSDSPSTIRPLFAALVFHQFFEGIALGGCIAQAGYRKVATFLMACLFAVTTPSGIALGIIIATSYEENSQSSLIVQGLFDAVSAGILIYMALVDLIAHDFLGNRLKGDRPLQAICYISLFGGALAMSGLAIWA